MAIAARTSIAITYPSTIAARAGAVVIRRSMNPLWKSSTIAKPPIAPVNIRLEQCEHVLKAGVVLRPETRQAGQVRARLRRRSGRRAVRGRPAAGRRAAEEDAQVPPRNVARDRPGVGLARRGLIQCRRVGHQVRASLLGANAAPIIVTTKSTDVKAKPSPIAVTSQPVTSTLRSPSPCTRAG